ncbi:MAG: hypothetical protein GF400_06565 [Candidatus Eisenbacteria bacterium]|nr:hypothetical protein [Candidatus Eisenbacteria bacterium]
MRIRGLLIACCTCAIFLSPLSLEAAPSHDTRTVCEWLLLHDLAEQQLAASLTVAVDTVRYALFGGMYREEHSDSLMVDGLAAGFEEGSRAVESGLVALSGLADSFSSPPALSTVDRLLRTLRDAESAFNDAVAVIEALPGEGEERAEAAWRSEEVRAALDELGHSIEALMTLEIPPSVVESARRLMEELE